MSSHASIYDEFQFPQRIKSHLTMEDAMCVLVTWWFYCVDPSVLKRMVHWADWTVGLWNLLTDTWLHVILLHHEFQHISRHQALQWKCFRKLAQRNGWVLAISVGVLSLSPGSYILKRMVFIATSFGDWRFKAVFWWEICRVTTLWNAAGHDPKGHGYRRHHQDRPLVSSDATAAAEEWCFSVQSSRNQKTDKWCLLLNHVEACSRMLRSTSHADDRFSNNKWRNWCRTNLGLETAPIKNFVSKTRFVSLGSYCALPSMTGKLQIEVTLHGARDLRIFTWPVVTANGVIVTRLSCAWWYFCYLELLMLHVLIPDACNKQPERDFRTCPSERSKTRDWPWYFRLRRRSTSFAKPGIPWRSRSFRLDEDQGRSSDLEQLKWLYRMTHTKIKVEAISLI